MGEITMRRTTLWVAVIIAGGVVTQDQIAASAQVLRQPRIGLVLADRKFVLDAARGNESEIQLGKLAIGEASTDVVRQFAQRMVRDHTRANDQLGILASNKNVPIPISVPRKQRARFIRLSRLTGPDFDRAYMREMVADHQHHVAQFRRQIRVTKDPDIRAWATRMLPILEQHLSLARSVNRAVNGPEKRTSNSSRRRRLRR